MRSVLVPLLLLTACESTPQVTESHTAQCDVEITPPHEDMIDVLFVVDVRHDGAGRAAIFERAAALVGSLRQSSDAYTPLSLHAGVVSSDLARGARLEPMAGGRFVDWRAWVDGQPDPAEVVRGTMMAMPIPTGARQPLEAMIRSLVGGVPENGGFVRTSSALLVVILTDGDDEGTNDPSSYARSFTLDRLHGGLRDNPRTAFLGLLSGACDAAPIVAGPAPRLSSVVDAVGLSGKHGSLCDEWYGTAFPGRVSASYKPACLGAPTVKGAAGCVVYDQIPTVAGFGYPASWKDVDVPACGEGEPKPCFEIVDSADCPAGRPGVAIRRDPGVFASPFTTTYVACECAASP